MKTIVPAIIGFVVLFFCSWRVHQDKAKRLHQDKVEIVVYNPDGVVIQPAAHHR